MSVNERLLMSAELPQLTQQLDPRDVKVADITGTVCLPFDLRSRSRLRAMLSTGEDVAIVLPRGSVMKNGAIVATADRMLVVQVIAAPEELLEVQADDAFGLLRAAYHLGNRHVQLQVLPDCLRLPYDYVLAEMVVKMGAKATKIIAPFDPEPGAYSAGGHHSHD
jgi:urease accessory protein